VKKSCWLTVSLIVIVVWLVGFVVIVPVYAQPFTHTVNKGDTLSDICEKYYGDPGLWPKLWQMNPFITNPHLLKAGDVVKLFEKNPEKALQSAEAKAPEPEKPSAGLPKKKKGIDVSGMVNVNNMGFLSLKPVVPWGYIASAATERVILSEGAMVNVAMKSGRQAKAGDLFTIYNKNPLERNRFSGKSLGNAVSFIGRVILKEQIRNSLFRAEILDTSSEVSIGDPILLFETVSSCVQPVRSDPGITSTISGNRAKRAIIGQLSVVYLAKGYNHGIRRGNILEIIKKQAVGTQKKETSYDAPLGYLLVLEARPDSATGVVVTVVEEFYAGAVVRGIEWTKAQRIFSTMPRCHFE